MANVKHHSIHLGSIIFVTALAGILIYISLFSIPSSRTKDAAYEKDLRARLKLSEQPIIAKVTDYRTTTDFSWYGKQQVCHISYIIHYYDGTVSRKITNDHDMRYNKDICDDFRARVNTDVTGRTIGANTEDTRFDIELSQPSDSEEYMSRSKTGTYVFVGVVFLIYIALKTHLIRSWRKRSI